MTEKEELRRRFNRARSTLARRKVWIEALKSGLYKKARGQLARGNGYCCLGVLCDLVDHKGRGSSWLPEDGCPSEEVCALVVRPGEVEIGGLIFTNDDSVGFGKVIEILEKNNEQYK